MLKNYFLDFAAGFAADLDDEVCFGTAFVGSAFFTSTFFGSVFLGSGFLTSGFLTSGFFLDSTIRFSTPVLTISSYIRVMTTGRTLHHR